MGSNFNVSKATLMDAMQPKSKMLFGKKYPCKNVIKGATLPSLLIQGHDTHNSYIQVHSYPYRLH